VHFAQNFAHRCPQSALTSPSGRPRRQRKALAAHPFSPCATRASETRGGLRLGLTGALYRTLRSTNAIENLNGSITTYARNVKRWRLEQMVLRQMMLRWVGAALHEASAHFRRVRGYRELAILIAALAKLDKETRKAA
jgi:hypothetical protein